MLKYCENKPEIVVDKDLISLGSEKIEIKIQIKHSVKE